MARQLRQQLDEEVEIIGKDDFGPGVRRPPGTPAAGTPPAGTPKPAPPPAATHAAPAEPAAGTAADPEDPSQPS
ncbi:hypothetical protein D3C83_218130 [compost metagenome]